eukprot:gene13629-16109_t
MYLDVTPLGVQSPACVGVIAGGGMFQPDSRCGVTLPRYDFTWVLTEKGRDQMHATADLFADSDFAPSWIYTSNFQRSFQSACVLREDFGMLFANLRTEFA